MRADDASAVRYEPAYRSLTWEAYRLELQEGMLALGHSHADAHGRKSPAPGSGGSWRPVESARNDAPDLIVADQGKSRGRGVGSVEHRGCKGLDGMAGTRSPAVRLGTVMAPRGRIAAVLIGEYVVMGWGSDPILGIRVCMAPVDLPAHDG